MDGVIRAAAAPARRELAFPWPALLAAIAVAACGDRPAPRPARVVLVTIDTLRLADFLGDDSTPSAMPRTRAFVERGALFENSFAATSTTQPSHTSLMTGLPPWEHGVTRNGQVLDEAFETVAEHLRAAGYSTHAVVSSFPLERRFGLAQGFDTYEDRFERSTGAESWEDEELPEGAFYDLADRTVDRALAALDRSPPGPQFLWVHFFDPHGPYGDSRLALHEPLPPGGLSTVGQLRDAAERGDPKLDLLLEQGHRSYRRDLDFLDAGLARLLDRLSGEADCWETHVVITADHGESFGEDGSFGHGTRLTPPQIQVPLAIVSPRVAAARRQDAAGSIDVFATLLDLAGCPVPPGHGRSLLQPDPPGRDAVFGMRRTCRWPGVDVRRDGTRHIVWEPSWYAFLDGHLLTGGPEGAIYTSPEGRLEDPAAVRAMHELFGGFAAKLAGCTTRTLDDREVVEALEALGYVR